jgi:ATP-dependent Clp protease ATP-binding subunit ClpC
LQILDDGRITDNYGRAIDFKNTILIMTSNVGARDIVKGGGVGFHTHDPEAAYDDMAERVKDEIQKVFNPEFLNRLDDVIVFHPLTRDHIREIVGVLMREVRARLEEEALKLQLTDPAVEFLVEHGFDATYGARPLKRAIQRYVEDPLSEKILMAELAPGDLIEVDVSEDGERLEFRVLSSSSFTA